MNLAAELGVEVMSAGTDGDGPKGRCSAFQSVGCGRGFEFVADTRSQAWKDKRLQDLKGLAEKLMDATDTPAGFSECLGEGMRKAEQDLLELLHFWEKCDIDNPSERESKTCCELSRLAVNLTKGGADAIYLMAKDPHGTRVLQVAVKYWIQKDRKGLAECRFILDACSSCLDNYWTSPHANHVLQTVIQNMPGTLMHKLVEELLKRLPESQKEECCKCSLGPHCSCLVAGVRAARHRFGCRVLERIFEHIDTNTQVCREFIEVLTEDYQCVSLMKHNYGNFVVQVLLEHGTVEAKSKIARLVLVHHLELGRHRIGSHVVEKVLQSCSQSDRTELVSNISRSVNGLKHTRYGSFVHRTAGKCREGQGQRQAQGAGAASSSNLGNHPAAALALSAAEPFQIYQ